MSTTAEETTTVAKGGPGDPLSDLFRFHAKIRNMLQMLGDLGASRVLGAEEIATAEGLLHFLRGPLMWHDLDEEASLLRRMRQAVKEAEELEVMRVVSEDHERMEETVEALVPVLVRVTEGSAHHLRELPDLKRKLAGVLEPHLTMEERKLFPIARRILSNEDLIEMRDEIEAREALRRKGQRAAVELPVNDDADDG
jgi:hemerythrin-like domain-containing protein